ncbi:MAG: YfhO family protein [Acutalibacteraceae bacterium]
MRIKSRYLAFLFTGLILLFGFYIGGLFPFGKGTISWCDMNQHGIPLLCDFKDILAGKAGMFLNMKNAFGMNFYGVFFFFLSSPFSFAAAFVPKADIPFLMNILVVVKLCLAAFTAALFFEKYASKIGVGLQAFLGTAYGLCGYGMLFYQNIMWLDIMYLFPVLMIGAVKLIKEGKPATFVLTLSLCVVMNYYISFMVFIFVIVFFGLYALWYKTADHTVFVNLGICGVLSLVLSAIVWIPCFLQYTDSARTASVLSQLASSSFFAEMHTTLSILLCTGIVFAVLALIIPRLSVADGDTRFLMLLLVAVGMPLVIEPVNLMWHTGSYMAFPARYGFVTVFAALMLVAKELSDIQYSEKSDYMIVTILFLIISALSVFMIGFTNKNSEVLSTYIKTLWGNEEFLSNLAIITIFAALASLAVLIYAKKRYLSRAVVTVFLCIILAAQGLCSVHIYMTSAKGSFHMYNYRTFLDLADILNDDKFYRVNTEARLADVNMTGAAGFNSISHYTSLNNRYTMEAAKQMGYSGYWMETANWGGSLLSDALLSIGCTVYLEDGNLFINKNPRYFGLGIKAAEDVPKELSDVDRLMSLDYAFGRITGSVSCVKQYAPSFFEYCDYTAGKDGYEIVSTIEQNSSQDSAIYYNIFVNGKQTLYFDCYNGFSNRLVETINGSFAIRVNGELISSYYPAQKNNGLLNLGSFEDTTVTVKVTVLKDVECSSFGLFGVEEDVFEEAFNKTESLDLKTLKNTIYGHVETAGKYFISIPYSKDYKITLNGQKINYTRALTGFILVDVPEDGELKITRIPQGFVAGAVLSVIGIVILIIYLRNSNRIENLSRNFKKAVYGIFLGVFATVIFVVYIFSIFVNLVAG